MAEGRWTIVAVVVAGLCLVAGIGARAVGQETAAESGAPGTDGAFALDAPLPVDPALHTGKLENGLRYYVRANPKPEKRAELRLVVDAGSVLEEESQQGLAHFLEHMAFNGTRHFAEQELVDYLESIGMRFGPDLNAYTGFDQTVYLLQVPTDRPQPLETAFQILQDWATGMTLAAEAIEDERGVVIEEWRGRRGAGARIRDQQFPVLFQGSLYARRLPIGEVEILESFRPEQLRRFYERWYRPDLMAVIAVGDFDPERVEALVRRFFGGLRAPAEAPPRLVADVPDHAETLVSIATDPELTRTSVSLAFKRDPAPEGTVADYRRGLVEALFYSMLNARLDERAQEADPPFLSASASGGSFVRTKDVNMLSATVEEGGLERGLEALLTEAERARRHGFLQSELQRQKKELLRFYEQAYNERDKTESRVYAGEYTRAFLEEEPVPGITFERELARRLIPGIRLAEVDRLSERFLGRENRVILVAAPETEEGAPASEESLLSAFRRVEVKDVSPWTDTMAEGPLFPAELAATLAPARIVERSLRDDIGVTQWRLENGIEVLLKPTDFKNDEVGFTSYSFGGHSLVPEEDWVPATTADAIVGLGGVSDLTLVELRKALAGKVARVSPYISELAEGFAGGGSPQDLETLFQLIYLYATQPRKDEEAFVSYRTRMRGTVENREARPETHFQDRLNEILTQGHPRRRPFTAELLEELDLDRSLAIYRERFADLDDSVFVFVGAFELAEIEPLVTRYLGNLPATERRETFRDVGVRRPAGVVRDRVYRGIEDKARVRIVFTGDLEWSRASRYFLGSMSEALSIRLRESLREELGGTYGVGAFAATDHYPRPEYRVSVSFGCDPERVDELVERVFSEIERLKREPVDDQLLAKIKETQRRQRETDLEDNGFWLGTLRFYRYHGEDLGQILDLERWIEDLTEEHIREAARQYLDTERFVQVVLLPERMEGEE